MWIGRGGQLTCDERREIRQPETREGLEWQQTLGQVLQGCEVQTWQHQIIGTDGSQGEGKGTLSCKTCRVMTRIYNIYMYIVCNTFSYFGSKNTHNITYKQRYYVLSTFEIVWHNYSFVCFWIDPTEMLKLGVPVDACNEVPAHNGAFCHLSLIHIWRCRRRG